MLGEILWETTIPGVVANRAVIDAATESVFVTDGWGVSYAALSVRRLSLRAGEVLARVRTRSRAAEALAVCGADLVISTDRRVIVCDAETLSVRVEHEYGGVRWPRRVAVTPDLIVTSNPARPAIAVIDRASGESARRSVGAEPALWATGDGVRVFSAVERGYRSVTSVGAPPKRVPGAEAFVGPVDGWAQRAGASDPRTGETRGGVCVQLDGAGAAVDVGDRRLIAVGAVSLWASATARGLHDVAEFSLDDGTLLRTIDLADAAVLALDPGTRVIITGTEDADGEATRLIARSLEP